MSYEFDTQPSYESFDSVRHRIETEIGQAGSLGNYLLILDDEYELSEERRGERAELERVAAFISNSGHDTTVEGTSFVYGSMLASKIAGYLYGNDEAGRGLAHAYYHDRYTEFNNPLNRHTRDLHPLQRMQILLQDIHEDLRKGMGGSIPDEYEDLIFEWSTELNDEAELDPYYLTIGFRMILAQALKPDSLEIQTYDLLESLEDVAPELPYHRQGDIQNVLSLDRAEDVIDFLDLQLPETETLSVAQKALRNRSRITQSAFSKEDQSDAFQADHIRECIEQDLNAYNLTHRFINPGDDISVNGRLQLRMLPAEGPGDDIRAIVNTDNQIIGRFEKIVAYEAPSQSELNMALAADENHLVQFDDAYTPAIRLTNAAIIAVNESGLPNSQDIRALPGMTIDIPLTYKDVVFERFI